MVSQRVGHLLPLGEDSTTEKTWLKWLRDPRMPKSDAEWGRCRKLCSSPLRLRSSKKPATWRLMEGQEDREMKVWARREHLKLSVDQTRPEDVKYSINLLPTYHKVTLKESEADSALKVIITSNKAESSSINAKQENRHVYVQTQILFTLISGTLHRVCRFKLKVMRYIQWKGKIVCCWETKQTTRTKNPTGDLKWLWLICYNCQ